MKKKTIIILALIVVVVLAAVLFFTRGGKSEMQVNTTTVKSDSIQLYVTATGYVQPVNKVDVGTQVSGVIERIYVDFNSQVEKGQLLAELDKSTLTEKLLQAKATHSSNEGDLVYAQQNYNRVKQLFDAKAATQASLEEATNRLVQAQNAVTNAKANVQQAQVNLSYAEIYSPISGIVLNRAVEEGQTVAASFNTPTLFTIANDLTKMQVEADVDEADIGSVKLGQPVTFTVDSYPDDTFTGTVNQIRLQPTVTSNVVTYVVIIEAPNPDEKLFPGMTASVSIETNNVKGLTIPVEALRFTPDVNALKAMGVERKSPPTGASNAPAANKGGRMIWVKDGASYRPQPVITGINDGVNVIVTDGLNEGETVVLSVQQVTNKKNGQAAANPLMPQRPGGGRR